MQSGVSFSSEHSSYLLKLSASSNIRLPHIQLSVLFPNLPALILVFNIYTEYMFCLSRVAKADVCPPLSSFISGHVFNPPLESQCERAEVKSFQCSHTLHVRVEEEQRWMKWFLFSPQTHSNESFSGVQVQVREDMLTFKLTDAV